MPQVTLNVDLGELPEEPEELYACATQVNVACGGHAGDAASMARAVALAASHGCLLAAHPSYPDRAGFGRSTMAMDRLALEESLQAQLQALKDVALNAGLAVTAIKPHGALYHDAAAGLGVARALLNATHAVLPGCAVVGPPSEFLMEEATAMGLTYVAECFADRAYLPSGGLVARSQAGALITSPAGAAAQAVRLAASGRFGTVCVHGDTPGAVDVARAVRAALRDARLL